MNGRSLYRELLTDFQGLLIIAPDGLLLVTDLRYVSSMPHSLHFSFHNLHVQQQRKHSMAICIILVHAIWVCTSASKSTPTNLASPKCCLEPQGFKLHTTVQWVGVSHKARSAGQHDKYESQRSFYEVLVDYSVMFWVWYTATFKHNLLILQGSDAMRKGKVM